MLRRLHDVMPRMKATVALLGARRDLSVAENLRRIGIRGLIGSGWSVARQTFGDRRQDHRHPDVLPIETPHPIMRNEPAASFLWMDFEDADAQVAQRRHDGRITDEEAARLLHWHANGFVVFKQCVPHALIDGMLDDLDRAWHDRLKLSIDVLVAGAERTRLDLVDESARNTPYKLNDFYLVSDNARKIFLNEQIIRFGEILFESEVIGINSLTFEKGTQQPAHIDHVYMTPTPARRLIASWVALEDIRADAGPLALWAGSHRLPPFDFGPASYHYTPELQPEYTQYLAEESRRFPRSEFMARKGDVLLWHSMFVHGGSPIQNPLATRKSMACHYFSAECYGASRIGMQAHDSSCYLLKHVEDPD
jgi:Phytanoyl-CoA dioxygenase (PhyH)